MSPARKNLRVAVLATVAVLLAGCGGGSSSNGGVAHLGSSARSSTATSDGGASPGSSAPEAAALAFSKCMRASGVPNFPDPKPGGGFLFHQGAGIDPSSPAFEAAQAKCQKLMPAGALAPGSTTQPSAQTVAHYLAVAQCMRRHGISDFPDPRTSVPSNLRAALGGRSGVISDIEGVILVFPGTIDEQSPAFTQAAAACAFPLHNH